MTEPSFPHWASDLRYVKRVRIKQVPVPSSLEQTPARQQCHSPQPPSPPAIDELAALLDVLVHNRNCRGGVQNPELSNEKS